MIITNNVMEHHLTIQMVLHIFFLQAFLDSYLDTNPYTPYATLNNTAKLFHLQ